MTSTDILKALDIRFSNHNYVLNNVFIYHGWESDFFSMAIGGYTYEIEVKVSKSDFRADFSRKTEKHKILSGYKKGIVVVPQGTHNNSDRPYSNIRIVDYSKHPVPNRFFYACPVDLLCKADIPSYAGLIHVDENGNCLTVKNAPLLHTHKNDLNKTLLNKYYYKYMAVKPDIKFWKHQVEMMKLKLKNNNIK